MFAMVLLVCHVANASDCRHVLVEDGFSAQPACMLRSMQVAPLWMRANPGFQLKRVECTERPHDLTEAGRV